MPLLPETKLQVEETKPHQETMMVSGSSRKLLVCILIPQNFRLDDDDDYDIESFFDGILGDDDGKETSWISPLNNLLKPSTSYQSFTDDDDDEDEDETPAAAVSQPTQQAVQQVSPVSSDAEAQLVGEEAVADNIDDISQSDGVETGAKDPQQAALDQAATVNNSIDPVGNEAIVDDEGKRVHDRSNNQNWRKLSTDDDDEDDIEDALDDDGKFSHS